MAKSFGAKLRVPLERPGLANTTSKGTLWLMPLKVKVPAPGLA